MDHVKSPIKIPINIRYADIDSLQHVNNARYFTFMEQARSEYFQALGLWDGQSMGELGLILAHTGCDFIRPIRFKDKVWIEASTVELGGKSFKMRYKLVNEDGEAYAQGEATLVCFAYGDAQPVPMPTKWRRRIKEFEGL